MKPKRFNRPIASVMTASALLCGAATAREKPATETDLIPPSTPLVACDPYFSIWSPGDKLAEVETTHWTGKNQPLTSLVRIDGKAHRVMGASPSDIPALEQKSLTVLPTRTIYTFEGAGVTLSLTFATPALPDDMQVLSRPVTYLTYEFRATDGKEHDVAVFFGAGGQVAANNPDQLVVWSDASTSTQTVSKIGTTTQKVLGSKGDDHRIDWGYCYIAAPAAAAEAVTGESPAKQASAFAENTKPTASTTPARADQAGVGIRLKPIKVGDKPVSTWAMIAYDDLFSIQYNRKNLRPYWRKDGWEAKDLLAASEKEYDALMKRCAAFDTELMADMTAIGGEKYAKITALAYRQCFAAGKFVADDNGQPLQFSKENHSNGCIATSDVFYPMAPQFLLFGPSLAKSFLAPFMEYAKSDRWKFPFAPHDLGTYPQANGQVYGGGEKTEKDQMPVEESGNVLLLMGAIAEMEGNADYASLYWPRLEQWAEYLKKEGFDPANQLCTDDFAGHLAHNVNLSAKAICALGSFARLCELRGEKEKAASYRATAQDFAKRWVTESKEGDHTRLAFDRPGTWSQKYNLVWDKILGLGLFPEEVLRTEMDFYKKMQKPYGLPLDNRRDYTKLDWIVWTASLTQNRGDFEALVSPVFKYLNDGPVRLPMGDWYDTVNAKKEGFTARPVVGGVFLPALYQKNLWGKYADRDVTKAKGWAPMPDYVAPVIKPLFTTAAEGETAMWTYSFKKPDDGWKQPDFDDSLWRRGPGGFGTSGTPNANNRTEWKTDDIWMRRTVTLPDPLPASIGIVSHHDEDIQVYVNGVLTATATGFNEDYEIIPLTPEGKSAFKPGKNVVAVHCRQTGGGQYIDVAIATIEPGVKK